MNDPRYRVITDDDKLEYVEQEKFVAEIATKCAETMDEFIFQMIGPYCEVITQRSISKHDLENALTQYFKGGWISVKDRLPDKDHEVLALMDGAIIRVMIYRYDDDGMSWEDVYGYFNSDDRVSHWMPLPEPPKEDIEE